MKITIECDCGNEVILSALPNKYTQLRDSLENQYFLYDGEDISAGKLKEIRIKCNKCNSWIALGVD